MKNKKVIKINGALLAVFCGVVTIILSIITAICGIPGILMDGGQKMACLAIIVTILINWGLHIESYINNIKAYQRRQGNVLTIALVETGYILFLTHYFTQQIQNGTNMGWQIFAIMFAGYIWVNAASLIAIPISIAKSFGIIVFATAVLMYLFGQQWSWATAWIIAICLFVNGYERVVMSMRGGRKNNESNA